MKVHWSEPAMTTEMKCDTFDLQKVRVILLLVFIVGGAEHTGSGSEERRLLGLRVVLELIDHAADTQTRTLADENALLLRLCSGR